MISDSEIEALRKDFVRKENLKDLIKEVLAEYLSPPEVIACPVCDTVIDVEAGYSSRLLSSANKQLLICRYCAQAWYGCSDVTDIAKIKEKSLSIRAEDASSHK